MNNVIENFFAAATANRFAAEGAIMGVIAYTLGFFFVPKEFFAGDFAVIAKSAAVDAGVAEADMVAWIAANADSIAAAVRVVGAEQGPREPVAGDATCLLDRGITRAQYDAGAERRIMD